MCYCCYCAAFTPFFFFALFFESLSFCAWGFLGVVLVQCLTLPPILLIPLLTAHDFLFYHSLAAFTLSVLCARYLLLSARMRALRRLLCLDFFPQASACDLSPPDGFPRFRYLITSNFLVLPDCEVVCSVDLDAEIFSGSFLYCSARTLHLT